MTKFKRNIISALLSLSLVSSLVTTTFIGAADYTVKDSVCVSGAIRISEAVKSSNNTDIASNNIYKTDATAKIGGIPLKEVEVSVVPKIKLIPCGNIFGIKFFTKGVMIVGMSDVESTEGILNPAYKSGLRVGDVILKINQKTVNTVEEISSMIENFDGKKLSVEFERNGEQMSTTLIPLRSLNDNKYKTGLWIRDSTAGIGTMTYYNPVTGEFGGLGHGICDVDTGLLMPMSKGNVVDISVTDIVKGIDGDPGEIKGSFGSIKKGELYSNTEKGVFGKLKAKPEITENESYEICPSSEIKEGEAYIHASLGDDEIHKFVIELTKIYRNNSDTKNFIFTVKDKELLEKTGGIVQGMSGSPIIQDGKLIGAVTHVLVNDPKKGYGIFIENMLSEAEKTN